MALKSILDIEVNDGAFRDYKRSFDQYHALVKSLPADFAKQWETLSKTKTRFNELVSLAIAQKLIAQQHVSVQKEAERLTRTQADYWKSIAKSSKEFATNIAGTTVHFLRWAAPLSLLGGLLGTAGGLWGLDRLAGAVSGQRRAALGLGVGYGQLGAFGLNYGRFVDTNSLLGGVSGALYNATAPGYSGLLAAGISQQYLNTHDAADVSAELLRRLPALFANTPRNLVGAKAEALGLNNVISSEDIVRYLNAPPEERRAQESSYQTDVGRFKLTPGIQRGWQDFLTQLDRAGTGIETTFVRGLAPLAPSLGKLSDAVESLVASALGNRSLQAWIDGLAGGIKNFGDYLGSPAFLETLSSLGPDLIAFGEGLKSVLRWFGIISTPTRWGPQDIAPKPGETLPGYGWYGAHGLLSPFKSGVRGAPPAASPGSFGGVWMRSPFLSGDEGWARPASAAPPGSPSIAQREAFIRSYAASIGMDPSVALYVAAHEGLGGLTGDAGTSGGDFQLHYNAQRSGVGDQYTAATGRSALDPAGWQDQDRFAMDFARRNGWGSWSSMRGHNPYEGIGTRPVVTIQDNTGGNTIVTTNQAVNN